MHIASVLSETLRCECAETAHEGHAAVAAAVVDAARLHGALGHQRLLQQQPGDATAAGAVGQTRLRLC